MKTNTFKIIFTLILALPALGHAEEYQWVPLNDAQLEALQYTCIDKPKGIVKSVLEGLGSAILTTMLITKNPNQMSGGDLMGGNLTMAVMAAGLGTAAVMNVAAAVSARYHPSEIPELVREVQAGETGLETAKTDQLLAEFQVNKATFLQVLNQSALKGTLCYQHEFGETSDMRINEPEYNLHVEGIVKGLKQP